MVRVRGHRIRGAVAVCGLLVGLGVPGAASAQARSQLRTLTYHGYRVTIPRSWPVFDLTRSPHTCVRFDRHALYLGTPGSEQSCPAQAAGRTEAILIEPQIAIAARAAAEPLAGSATTFADVTSGVEVTATWRGDRALIETALHRRTLPAARASRLEPRLQPRTSGGGSPIPSSVYAGPGFDLCDAPSAQHIEAWTLHSPYHAIGVYIGGANAACPPAADPNLTPTWLADEAGAGWHFIPTYVGLQAPTNSCGCAPIQSSQATAEGTAAADDAITQAQSLEMPAGTPIYDDMEFYSRTAKNTSAVLAFLAAWTTELHAKGYVSGVYGNADSAIADLATQYGTSYPEPDEIWFADWPGDGSQSTNDPSIPSADWTNNQRLHQYSGAHDETYGGVTLNIDGDYLDGATASTFVTAPPPPPSFSISTTPTGMTNLDTSWSGLGLSGWEVLAGTSASTLSSIRHASVQGAQTEIAVRSSAPYFAVQALGPSGQILASSATVSTPLHLGLFARSSFFGQSSGIGAMPVGCYLAVSCHISATISAGRTRLTRTTAQAFRAGGSGLLYYRLNPTGRRLLTAARNARLPVTVTLEDSTGASSRGSVTLIPFTTAGRGPTRAAGPAPVVSVAGTTEYVDRGSGGVLARCSTASACWVTARLSVGRTTIASTGSQLVGGLELGYAFFSLNGRGRQLLSQAPGNQLGATLTLRSGTSVARARIALVQYR